MTSNEVIMQLLREIGDLGTQDLYTDAEEYSGRTAALHGLCTLAGRIADGEDVTAQDVQREASDADSDHDGEMDFCALPGCCQGPEEGSDYCLIHLHHQKDEEDGELEADDQGQMQRDEK